MNREIAKEQPGQGTIVQEGIVAQESFSASRQPSPSDPVIQISDLCVSYNSKPALQHIDLDIERNKATAFIGPSGCGKTTLLKSFNRMNDLIEGLWMTGTIKIRGVDIYNPDMDVTELRQRVGMVFQKSNPFPRSVYENVAYGPRLLGVTKTLGEVVEKSLRAAALWDEVNDRLHENAFTLSGGQQQRLCIARALAVEPDVLLMDEPCSSLDPIATTKIEELIHELKEKLTIVIVTHNMQQAGRVSDHTAFLYMGELIEFGTTSKIFTSPEKRQTEDYITGRFG